MERRLIDVNKLSKDIETVIEDAPLHIQATVQQYIDGAPRQTLNQWCMGGGYTCQKNLTQDMTPTGAVFVTSISQWTLILRSQNFAQYAALEWMEARENNGLCRQARLNG